MAVNYKALGVRIRKVRERKGMTQQSLAEKIDISVPYMSNIERAKKTVSLSVLMSIAQALDVTLDELLADSYPEHKEQDVLLTELGIVLEQCEAGERRIIVDTVASLADILMENRRGDCGNHQ